VSEWLYLDRNCILVSCYFDVIMRRGSRQKFTMEVLISLADFTPMARLRELIRATYPAYLMLPYHLPFLDRLY
jgi:hypothetical protein